MTSQVEVKVQVFGVWAQFSGQYHEAMVNGARQLRGPSEESTTIWQRVWA